MQQLRQRRVRAVRLATQSDGPDLSGICLAASSDPASDRIDGSDDAAAGLRRGDYVARTLCAGTGSSVHERFAAGSAASRDGPWQLGYAFGYASFCAARIDTAASGTDEQQWQLDASRYANATSHDGLAGVAVRNSAASTRTAQPALAISTGPKLLPSRSGPVTF